MYKKIEVITEGLEQPLEAFTTEQKWIKNYRFY